MISISGWLLFFLINGLAIYSSWCLAGRLLRREDPLASALVATGLIYFTHITAVVLLLGLVAQALNVYTVAGLSTALSLTLMYFFRPHRPAFVQPVRKGWRELFAERDYFLYALAGLFCIQLLILIAKLVVLPPHIWDVFTYHLPPAAEWFQQGRIPLELDTPVRRMNSMTLGMTVLAYWFFIFLRDDMLVALPQFLWALLLLPVTYAALREGGVEQRWSAKFALVVFFIPIVIMQAVTAKDHLGLNIGFFAALLFMVTFLKHGHYRHLLLAAVAFGLMLGYKMSGPIYPVIAGAIFVWLVWRNRAQALSESAERSRFLKTLAAGVLIIVALGGFWYIKNLALYGHLQGRLTVAEQRAVQRESMGMEPVQQEPAGTFRAVADRFGLNKLSRNLAQFFPRVFDYGSPYGADLPGISGFGPQFTAFGFIGLVAVFAALISRRQRHAPVNLFGYAALAVLLFYFLFYATSNSYRLFSFFAMLMITFAAITLQGRGLLANRAVSTTANVVILLCVAWSVVLLSPPHYTNYLKFREFLSLNADRRTTANYTRWFAVHQPSMYELITDLPDDVPLAYIAQEAKTFPGKVADDTWIYPYYGRHWRRRLTYVDSQEYLSCNDQFMCEVKPALKTLLTEKKIPLVTACESNLCLRISDPDFFEMAPGLYYFRTGRS